LFFLPPLIVLVSGKSKIKDVTGSVSAEGLVSASKMAPGILHALEGDTLSPFMTEGTEKMDSSLKPFNRC
jgi:hypothetical protein